MKFLKCGFKPARSNKKTKKKSRRSAPYDNGSDKSPVDGLLTDQSRKITKTRITGIKITKTKITGTKSTGTKIHNSPRKVI